MRWLPLILLFLLVWIEVWLFVQVASVLGVFFSLLLIIATSCLGLSLVRSKGVKTVRQLEKKLAMGESPAAEMVNGVSLFFAGFLLMIPGFFTDFLALLLLLPPVQKLLTLRLVSKFHVYSTYSSQTSEETTINSGHTIDGEYQRKDD